MSLFDTPNADAYTVAVGEGAKGPRLGFQDAFMAAWDVQTKVNSLYGLEVSFRDIEQKQRKRMIEAGITPPESIGGADDAPYINTRRYMDAARAIVDADYYAGEAYGDETTRKADEQLKKLQLEHPELGLKTYAEMFGEVQTQAKEALARDSLSTTTMGAIGGFIGGAAASMSPETDPLNALTLGFGGPGTTVLRRIAVQGAAQMGVEGINIGLTPDTHRLLTGRDQTAGEIAARTGFAAVGGAGGQALGEAVGAGVRRLTTGKWFDDLPVDKLPTREPAPPRVEPEVLGERMPADRPFVDYPDFEVFARSQGYNLENPYGPSRQAVLRHADDIAYVANELDRWDGPQAHAVAARTDTALPPNVEPGVRYDGAYQRYVDRLETADDIARRLDPDTFAVYDKLAVERNELRNAIDRGREFGDLRPNADRPDVKAQFEAERAARELTTRQRMLEVDVKMRDLAPLVSRAMGAAEKEWRSTPIDFNTLNFLKDLENRTGWRYRGDDKPSLTEQPMRLKAGADPLPVTTVADAVPVSVLTPEQSAKLRPGHDAADRVAIAVNDAIDDSIERTEKFIGSVRKVATMEAKELQTAQGSAREALEAAQEKAAGAATPEERKAAADGVKKAQEAVDELTGITLPDGQRLDFNATMKDLDGNDVTVREFLAEMDANNQALQATRTCSAPS